LRYRNPRRQGLAAARAAARSDEVTIQSGVEPELDEPADMEATMAIESVEYALNHTSVRRVHFQGRRLVVEVFRRPSFVEIG
jgi:hypothetical protein